MRKDEKKPKPWEAVDPKVPIVESGHLDNKRNR